MPSTREPILTAQHASLQALAATVLHKEVLPKRIPPAGLIILRGGQPGKPQVTLAPLRYHRQHRAKLAMIDQTAIDRATAFDTLIASVGAALAADRTHGGHCDRIVPEAPASIDLPTEGAMALKVALFTCVWRLTTTRPQG